METTIQTDTIKHNPNTFSGEVDDNEVNDNINHNISETNLPPTLTSSLIKRICDYRDKSIHEFSNSLDLLLSAQEKNTQAVDYAEKGAGLSLKKDKDDLYFRGENRIFELLSTDINTEELLKSFRYVVDRGCWNNLMSLTRMFDIMDTTSRKEFDKMMDLEPLELNPENALSMFKNLARNSDAMYKRGVAEAFINLDRRFKSHNGFGIGSRIIIDGLIDNRYGGMHIYGHDYQANVLKDVENAFYKVDNFSIRYEDIINTIDNGVSNGTYKFKFKYFRINIFKNGNAHLWFNDDELVKKVNLLLADYYGEVLPDGVTKDGTDEDFKRGNINRNIAKDLAFYPTPEDVVHRLLYNTYIDNDDKILEPSAGEGHIIDGIMKKKKVKENINITAVEIDSNRCAILRDKYNGCSNIKIHNENFLDMKAVEIYDLIIMNPPFYGTHYMNHIRHAYDFLKPGGKLISILPASASVNSGKKHEAFRKWVNERPYSCTGAFSDLPMESFKSSGTNINTCIIEIKKKNM